MTQEEVAEEVGVSRKTVGKVLRSAGVSRADRKAKKIKNLSEKGKPVEEIAKKTGCSNRTVYRALQNTADKNEAVGGAPKAAQNEPVNPEANTSSVDVPVNASVNCAAQMTDSQNAEAETQTAMAESVGASVEEQDVAGAELNSAEVRPADVSVDGSADVRSESSCAKMSPGPANNGYHRGTNRRADGTDAPQGLNSFYSQSPSVDACEAPSKPKPLSVCTPVPCGDDLDDEDEAFMDEIAHCRTNLKGCSRWFLLWRMYFS